MQDIPAQLIELHTAYVEKIGGQPAFEVSLSVRQSGNYQIGFYDIRASYTYKLLKAVTAKSAEKVISDARAYVDSLPDPDIKAKRDWQGKLGKVIDEGHALNLPDEVMSPLRQGSQAMTENLLTHEAAE